MSGEVQTSNVLLPCARFAQNILLICNTNTYIETLINHSIIHKTRVSKKGHMFNHIMRLAEKAINDVYEITCVGYKVINLK